MDSRTLRPIDGTEADIKVEKLNRLRVFERAAAPPDGRRATSTCKIRQSQHVAKIRHGFALVLRIIIWLITEQPLSDTLPGCPLLEALELNTRELLAVTAERLAGSFNSGRLVGAFAEKRDARVSRVARVMESMFYEDGAQHAEVGDETRGEWCYIGGETVEEWEEALSSNLWRARSNGM